ncbi:hypothetical protein Q1695_005516 [Nippostrongylus brasiliensis]|nr:hypothetical protein Q1695_005516 [Nippostrongylus brasiliensis]
MINTTDESSFSPPMHVLLSMKASELSKKDVVPQCEVMCVVWQFVGRLKGKGKWKERGRTERLKGSLNPEWSKKLRLEYIFEERQTMRFEIYTIETTANEVPDYAFIGCMECELSEILCNQPLKRTLSGERAQCGSIIVTSEEVDEGAKVNAEFRWSAKNLDKKDFLGKSDPYLNIYRVNDDGSRLLVHRTEVVNMDLNPVWKPFEVNLKMLCSGDHNRPFRVKCFDHDWAGSHDLIGGCEVSLSQLLDSSVKSLQLINDKKRTKKGEEYRNSGTLEFNNVQLLRRYTFLDYIYGGMEIDFTVAIDFTNSNGPMHKSSSLHYINPSQSNQYELTIRSVLDICKHYNSRKMFDAFGFGAILTAQNTAPPLFALNFDSDPSVKGVSGVMEAYRLALSRVKFHGPTNISPVIKVVAKKVTKLAAADCDRYHVLLIITDGAITDMAATKSAIIAASLLPLSIIIVGVGKEEFETMAELRPEEGKLTHGGRTVQRDIVQVLFLPLRKILDRGSVSGDSERAMALLAKEVLADIPNQITSYMRRRKIFPRSNNIPMTEVEAAPPPSPPNAVPNAAYSDIPPSVTPPGHLPAVFPTMPQASSTQDLASQVPSTALVAYQPPMSMQYAYPFGTVLPQAPLIPAASIPAASCQPFGGYPAVFPQDLQHRMSVPSLPYVVPSTLVHQRSFQEPTPPPSTGPPNDWKVMQLSLDKLQL